MIYITGDTHIPYDIQKLSAKNFYEQRIMTKSDYVIICGDFGGVWDKSKEEEYWKNGLKRKISQHFLLTAIMRILILYIPCQ